MMASTTFGFAGVLWLLAVLLIVFVLGNEIYPRFCPNFIRRMDNLGTGSKLALSGFSIVFATIYPFLAIVIWTFGSNAPEVGTETYYATITVPVAGFAPLLAFGMLRESRLHRCLRGDRGITIR